MKLFITLLLPGMAYAGLFSDDARDYAQKLAKIGDRIVKAESRSEPIDWSCEIDGTDYCEKETLKHYDLKRKEVEVKGSDLRKHLDELKAIKEKETVCMASYETAKSEEEIQNLVTCLKEIKYEYSMPKDIHYFYMDPKKILNSNNRDLLVSSLETKLFAIKNDKKQEDINGKDEVENEVVADKDFKKHQQKIKEAEKKYGKYPPVPSSQSLLSSKHAGKRFRILIQSDDTHNARATGKTYQFTYINLADTGFSHSGYGNYLLTCESGNCLSTGAYWDEEVYTANDAVGTFKKRDVLKIKNFNAVVESTGKSMEAVNGLGQKLVLPVLRIIETY